MSTADSPVRSKEWLTSWDPENESSWDSKLAWQTLWITTFTLTMCFVAWFLPSALVPKLNAIGYSWTKEQLYWLAAIPGLSGGLMRLVWMVLPPIMGTRKMVTLTTLLLIFPILGWGVRVQSPTAPYWELLTLAFLAGIGGGAFSGFMPSTSYFFPRKLQGTALGLQAGIGNFGVSLVQLLTPWLVGFGMLGFLGVSQQMKVPGKPDADGVVPERRVLLHPVHHHRRDPRLDDAEVGAGQGQHPPAVRHLHQPGHLVDDGALRHDVRHLLRPVGPVRPADEQPVRRRQPVDPAGCWGRGEGARRGLPPARPGGLRLPRPADRCRGPGAVLTA